MTGAPEAGAGERTAGAAALLIALAPSSGAVMPALEPVLGGERCAALQALLIRSAATPAAAAALLADPLAPGELRAALA